MNSASRDYLCVEPYMADIAGARALSSAFELGLVDALLARSQAAADLQRLNLDARGLGLLLDMLRANAVVQEEGGTWRLRDAFQAALRYRDLLVQKLEFAHRVAPDFTGLFSTLLARPQQFFEQARLFELFSYQRCYESTPENIAATERWMRITTALTRYEAAACLAHHDFSQYKRMLDVGGNSGEFALQACRLHAQLQATVHDLPVVCEIGARHVKSEPEGGRIGFAPVNRESTALPMGHDLISFKSMLHDWPDAQMEDFLARAHAALEPGGTLLIFERGQLPQGAGAVPYGQLPFLLFFRSYRAPQAYEAQLARLGFRDVAIQVIELEMPFILVTAVK